MLYIYRCGGYDLMFANSNKDLHLIPSDVNTPEKLKTYNIGCSAIYIHPRHNITLGNSSRSSTH